MAAKGTMTFRVQGIPLGLTDQGLRIHLNTYLTPVELGDIQLDIVMVPSFHAVPKSKNALVRFHPRIPVFLEWAQKDKTRMEEHHSRMDNAVIRIDLGFLGLTQISDNASNETDLEYA